MKEYYEAPEAEVVEFDDADIVCTSTCIHCPNPMFRESDSNIIN